MALHQTSDSQSRTQYRGARVSGGTTIASPPTVPPFPSPDNPEWRLLVEMPDYSTPLLPPLTIEFDLRDLPPFTLGDESANVVLDLVDEYLALQESVFTERELPGQVVVSLLYSGWGPNGAGNYQSFVTATFVGRDAIQAQLGLTPEEPPEEPEE